MGTNSPQKLLVYCFISELALNWGLVGSSLHWEKLGNGTFYSLILNVKIENLFWERREGEEKWRFWEELRVGMD